MKDACLFFCVGISQRQMVEQSVQEREQQEQHIMIRKDDNTRNSRTANAMFRCCDMRYIGG